MTAFIGAFIMPRRFEKASPILSTTLSKCDFTSSSEKTSFILSHAPENLSENHVPILEKTFFIPVKTLVKCAFTLSAENALFTLVQTDVNFCENHVCANANAVFMLFQAFIAVCPRASAQLSAVSPMFSHILLKNPGIVSVKNAGIFSVRKFSMEVHTSTILSASGKIVTAFIAAHHSGIVTVKNSASALNGAVIFPMMSGTVFVTISSRPPRKTPKP